MDAIEVIYENGLFRPVAPIVLPEATRGKVVISAETELPSSELNAGGMEEVYAILSERYESGQTDTAARHNEHQP